MSKTNRYTLIATLLLGILLYTVARFADDLPEVPMAGNARAVSDAPDGAAYDRDAPAPAAALPRVAVEADLIALLERRGLDARRLIDGAAAWYEEHGFVGTHEVLGISIDAAQQRYYDSIGEPKLRSLSDSGDPAATQTLAKQAMFVDPFSALDLYTLARAQGSVYAGIRVADTLSALAAARGVDAGDPGAAGPVDRFETTLPDQSLRTEALASLLAAMRDGGVPIIDDELLEFAANLERAAPPDALERACLRSVSILVETGKQRRKHGAELLATQPPPVFLSPANRVERMPCRATDYPIASMMDLSRCVTERVQDGSGRENELFICAP